MSIPVAIVGISGSIKSDTIIALNVGRIIA